MTKKCILSIALAGLLVFSFALAQDRVRMNDPANPSAELLKNRVSIPIPVPSTAPGYKIITLATGLKSPRGVGVKPLGDKIYVCTEDDYSLWAYHDGAIHRVLTMPTLNDALHASRYRKGYFAGSDEGQVFKVIGGTAMGFLSSPYLNSITAMDIDKSNGDIYFAVTSSLYRLSKGQTTATLIVTLPDTTWGLAVRGSQIFISQSIEGLIYQMPKSGGSLTTIASGLDGPCDIAFDSAGNLLVCDFNGGTIEKLHAGTWVRRTIVWDLIAPYYLGMDSSGNIYFSDFEAGVLYKVKKV